MSRIAILYCKRIKDHSCTACSKCYKGMAEKNGEFAPHDEIDIGAMTDYGGCPGLAALRVKILDELTRNLERPIDTMLRMKRRLGISSTEFLEKYTILPVQKDMKIYRVLRPRQVP